MVQKVREFINNIDPGFLVVLAISLIAIWPFISRASLPEGTDAELHIFRLYELSYLIRGGELYPRWAPNFYHGYGYPIFNYYAPLTYYLGMLVELTPWADAVTAVKAVFVMGMLLAGIGMYGFVRDIWGRRAGYVAAAVFLYAPYIQYIDPHARGVLPESFSFGAFACALWALNRLRLSRGRWAWLASVFLVSAVILSHNLMGLLFFGMLSAWVLWLLVFDSRSKSERRNSVRLLLPALGLALGLASFFWLPVLIERNAVNLNTLIGSQDNYDFHSHFLSLSEMFAPTKLLDWGATEPAFRFNLGVAQWLLGGIGIIFVLIGPVKNRRHLTFFVFMLGLLVFLMLPWSTVIWESIPFLPFFQFPWRLLGAAAAMLAVLAGAGTAAFQDMVCNRPQDSAKGLRHLKHCDTWTTSIFVLLPIVLGLPLSQPTPWPDFGEVNHLRMTLIENTGRWLGTTSTADYVPATVDIIPKREASVVAPFAEGFPPDRINWANLPEEALVETEIIRPLLTRYTLSTPRDTRLRLFLFDFPGWQVRVDGKLVETELGRPEGFIVVPVPAGEHVVEVEFDSTPPRKLAWIISLFSLLMAIVVAWRLPKTGSKPELSSFRDWSILFAVLLLSAIAIFVLEPAGLLHQNSQGWTAEPAQYPVYGDFGDQIALLGYDLSQERAKPGDTIYLTLYWKAQEPLDINYQVFVHIFDDNGLVTQSDKLNPGDYPTRRWPTDQYVRDEHRLTLPLDISPGEYELAVGVWVQSDGWRLPLLDEGEEQISDRLIIRSLIVE